MSYKSALLKLSGEAMAGEKGVGIDPNTINELAKEIIEASKKTKLAIVVGGGNFWRGKEAIEIGMDRTDADYVGMLGTIMNAKVLEDAINNNGGKALVMTSIEMYQVAEPYIVKRAKKKMENNIIVILAGGTGSPYFSTDTTSTLRASELNIDAILMGKNGTDGVYDKDPNKHEDAKRYNDLTYDEVLNKELQVMDLTAATMAKDNDINLVVFDMNTTGNIKKAINKEKIGTTITK